MEKETVEPPAQSSRPMHHTLLAVFYIRKLHVWVCWPRPPTVSPLRAYIPFFLLAPPPTTSVPGMGKVPISVTEPPGPASTMEDQPAASFPQDQSFFLLLLLPKTLPVAQQLQRHFGRWSETAKGRESVCRLVSSHNNSPSAFPGDTR